MFFPNHVMTRLSRELAHLKRFQIVLYLEIITVLGQF